MIVTGRIIQGTAAVLLASGAIKIVTRGLGRVRDKVGEASDRRATAPVAGEDIEVSSGHRGLRFATVGELPKSVTMRTGDLGCDLGAVPVTADAAVALELGTGTLRLALPKNQNWVVAWSIGRGTFVSGQERRAGSALVGRNAHTPLPGEPTLTVTAVVTTGLLSLR